MSEKIDGVVVTDSRGRNLTLRQLTTLQESRVIRATGEANENVSYVNNYVIPSALVAKIDDIDMVLPTTGREIEAAIDAVGSEGIVAVMQHLVKLAEQLKTAAGAKQALKNS